MAPTFMEYCPNPRCRAVAVQLWADWIDGAWHIAYECPMCGEGFTSVIEINRPDESKSDPR